MVTNVLIPAPFAVLEQRLDDALDVAAAATDDALNAAGAAETERGLTATARTELLAANPLTLGARDAALAAQEKVEEQAERFNETLPESQSDAYNVSIEFQDGGTLIGYRPDTDDTYVHNPFGDRADFNVLGFGDVEAALVQSTNYLAKVEYQDGGVALGVRADGTLEVNGADVGTPTGGASGLTQPTWVTDDAELITITGVGQSLMGGRRSFKPDAMMNAMTAVVAPGRAFMFGDIGPRVRSDDDDEMEIVAASKFATLYDHREAIAGASGATSTWACIAKLVADGVWPRARFLSAVTAIGGSGLDKLSGFPDPLDPDEVLSVNPQLVRRAALYAAAHARQRGTAPFMPVAIFLARVGHADRNDPQGTYLGRLLTYFDLLAAQVVSEGAQPTKTVFTIGACGGVYTATTPSNDVGLAALDAHLARANVLAWGPEYILETAVGAYMSGIEDSTHLAAVGQARAGLHEGIALSAWARGTKRNPLYVNTAVPANATCTAAGLVTLTYANPRATALAIDATHVTNPGGNRPYGFMYAPGTGVAPHGSVQPVQGSFSAVGNVLTFSLSGARTANPYINVANWSDGISESGPDRAARACVRNDGSADSLTIGGVTLLGHDYVMPQRIPLQSI